MSKLSKLKEERTKQWANNRKVPRGWNRYRASTFLEVVGAKTDRALQCQDLIQSELNQLMRLVSDCTLSSSIKKKKIQAIKKRIKKLEFDALDSCYDAMNYMSQLIEKVEKDPKFLCSVRMP